MKHRRLILCAVVGFALAALGGWMALRPVSAITKEAFEKIENGMTLSEVEEILGGPARDVSTGTLVRVAAEHDRECREDLNEVLARAFTIRPLMYVSGVREPPSRWSYWISDSAQVAIDWDDNELVAEKEFMAVYRKWDGLWPTLQKWFRL